MLTEEESADWLRLIELLEEADTIAHRYGLDAAQVYYRAHAEIASAETDGNSYAARFLYRLTAGPLAVPCARCKVPVGEPCQTIKRRKECPFHSSRWYAWDESCRGFAELAVVSVPDHPDHRRVFVRHEATDA
jgi:hypothetical protein